MRLTLIGLLLIMMTLLSGCWSLNEAERMLYIHAIGIDYKDNQYEIYAQIINFANVAKSDTPRSEIEQAEVGFATGNTIEDAIFNLYRSTDERVFWGHLTFIIFSEEALKDQRMNAAIDVFTRFIETRYRILLYSTQDPVKDVLLTVPIINTAINLSKLGDPANSYQQESFIEPVDMRRLLIGLNEPNHEMAIPLISVINNWESAKGIKKIPMLSGVSLITPDDYKGFIAGKEVNGLQWMNNDTKRGEISFLVDENDKNSLVSVTLSKVRVEVKPIVEKETVRFDIKVSMDATPNSVPYKVKTEVLIKGLEEAIKREIKVTYKEALDRDVDIYRLSEHVYRKNNMTWKKFQKDGKIELTEDSIRTLDVDIRKFKAGRKSLSDTFK